MDEEKILPFIGYYDNASNTYTLFIPKLSRSLINVHLINEVNLFCMFGIEYIDICRSRFYVDYFHIFNLQFNEIYNFKVFNMFGNVRDVIYNYDIIQQSNNLTNNIPQVYYSELKNIILELIRTMENELLRNEILSDYNDYFIVINNILVEDNTVNNFRLNTISYVNDTYYDYNTHSISKMNIVVPYCIHRYNNMENLVELNSIEQSPISDGLTSLSIMYLKYNPIILSKDYINPNKHPNHNQLILYLLMLIIKRYTFDYYNNELLIKINIQSKLILDNIFLNVEENKKIYNVAINPLFNNRQFRYSQQIIKMFYEYVYSEKKIIHVNAQYFINGETQKNYLIALGNVTNLTHLNGICGSNISPVNIEKNNKLHENILLKEYKVNLLGFKQNVQENIEIINNSFNRQPQDLTGLNILSYIDDTDKSFIEYLISPESEGKLIDVFDNLESFASIWTIEINKIYINNLEYPHNSYYAKYNFAKEIIKIIIYCSAIKFFQNYEDIENIVIKTSGGSLGLGIDLFMKNSINLINLNNIFDYIKDLKKIDVINKFINFDDLIKRNIEQNMIKDIISTFLLLYKPNITQIEKKDYGISLPQSLVFQEILLNPICNITSLAEQGYENCITDNKYILNNKFAKSLDEQSNNTDTGNIEPEIFYKDLLNPVSINLESRPDNIEKICFTSAPAKIRIFVYIGKYNNKFFVIIPEISSFEYIIPFAKEKLSTNVEVNQIGGHYSFSPSSNRFISNSLGSIDGFWSNKIMNNRSLIDSPDTNNCMNHKIYPEIKKLIDFLSPSLIEYNFVHFNSEKNFIGRYAIDILYKEDDANCKLKVIDINNLGALMDLRAGYDTLLLILKMAENNDLYDETTKFYKNDTQKIKGFLYNRKIFERTTNQLYHLEDASRFNRELKIHDSVTNMYREQQFTIAFYENTLQKITILIQKIDQNREQRRIAEASAKENIRTYRKSSDEIKLKILGYMQTFKTQHTKMSIILENIDTINFELIMANNFSEFETIARKIIQPVEILKHVHALVEQSSLLEEELEKKLVSSTQIRDTLRTEFDSVEELKKIVNDTKINAETEIAKGGEDLQNAQQIVELTNIVIGKQQEVIDSIRAIIIEADEVIRFILSTQEILTSFKPSYTQLKEIKSKIDEEFKKVNDFIKEEEEREAKRIARQTAVEEAAARTEAAKKAREIGREKAAEQERGVVNVPKQTENIQNLEKAKAELLELKRKISDLEERKKHNSGNVDLEQQHLEAEIQALILESEIYTLSRKRDREERKYLKYKLKYMQLKKKLNNF